MEELTIVRLLLNRLNENISYCHWKSNQHFNNALVGIDDLDILIDREQYYELTTILIELNFKRFYTPISRTYVGIEDYLGFDSNTGAIVHLHLHCQLMVGEKHLKGFHIPLEHRLLKNRIWNDKYNAFMTSPYDELLLLLLRIGLKNRKRDIISGHIIETNAVDEYGWLKDKCPDFIARIKSEEKWLSERIIRDLNKLYNEGFSWWTLFQLKHHMYEDLECYTLSGGLGNTFSRNYHEFARIILEIKKRLSSASYKFLRRRSATGGIIISFLGSDGAGKSSAISETKRWLAKVADVRVFYLGSGDGKSSIVRLPLRMVKRLLIKLKILKKTNNFSDTELKEREKIHFSAYRKLWIYTLSKERIKKITRANRCRTRGYIVLTDRYPQSEFEGLCDGPKLKGDKGICANAEMESFRYASLCPPDLAIKLIVSPEEAMKRKTGEIDRKTSENLTKRIKKIKFSDKTTIREIDADKDQKTVQLEIKRAIWEAL